MIFFNLFNKNESTSLRKRYFSLTLLLGLLVIVTVLFFFINTVATKKDVTADRVLLEKKQSILSEISTNRLPIFRNIEQFLLDPAIGHHDKAVIQLINSSLQNNEDFFATLSTSDFSLKEKSEHLNQLLTNLQKSVSDLFESRLNVNQQYPGLSLAVREMMEPQQVISNNYQLLINEIDDESFEPVSEKLFPLLLKTSIFWEKIVSQYRLYLTNRFATFSSDFLGTQAESLGTLMTQFWQDIDLLHSIYEVEDSFEGESLVISIKEMSEQWYQAFEAVRKIQESENWRTDTKILEKTIIPIFEQISMNIKAIGFILNEHNKMINSKIEKNSNTLFALIVTIIVLFFIFITAILVSLDRMIFIPIDKVSNALKLKAFDQEAPQIKTGKAKEISNLVEAFQEMDEKVNKRQNELEHQALHDHLTALPNRFKLSQRLEYQILTSERNQKGFSLFFMDMNNFKDVNDTFGHSIGDKLLLQVANRISKIIRKSDTVARLGGDEFAVLLPEINKKESERVALSIQKAINNPFNIDSKTISASLSIGIVCYPEDGSDSSTLLRHADSAMYLAKRNRSPFAHYDKSIDLYTQNRLTLVQDLRNAIENDELMLYYQPQLLCETNEIYGAEALLRWKHPEFGFIHPEKIIDLAEYSGIIHLLTNWVLKRAIAECQHWHKHDFPITLSVNLSVQDLNNEELHETVSSLLNKCHLNTNYLTLEITESGMMENPAHSIEMLNRLKKMGVNLSVDDFGTGFSSLKYLKQLPVDELKIDKSFVMDIANNENDLIIVRSTINLGHNLGLEVVAEGIEDDEVLNIINTYHCDRAQGYHFEKPLSGDDFLHYLKKHSSRPEKIA